MTDGFGCELALVGCGAVARGLYTPALSALAGSGESLTFVDVDEGRARDLAADFPEATILTDHEDALDVDGAIIAVPHHLHYSIARDFLDAGVHVLVEKPVTETAADLEDLLDRAERSGSTLAANYTRRLYPNNRRIRELLASGAIGDLRRVRFEEGDDFDWPTTSGFYFTSGKGVLMDRGPHVVDLLCWWFDEQPTVEAYRDDSQGGIEAFAELDLEFDPGTSATVRLSWLSRLRNECRIEGTEGSIVVEPHDWRTLRLERGGSARSITVPSEHDTFDGFGRDLLSNFIAVVDGEERPLVGGEDVRASVGAIEDAYERREPLDLPWLGTGARR